MGVKFEKTTSLTHTFMEKLKGNKSDSDSSDFSGPIRVQLWSERLEEPSEVRMMIYTVLLVVSANNVNHLSVTAR